VATRNGGPVDIVATLGNGVLVEPTDEGAIADALVKARGRRRRRLARRAWRFAAEPRGQRQKQRKLPPSCRRPPPAANPRRS